jgi:predicted CXXCH cytochrome family protein
MVQARSQAEMQPQPPVPENATCLGCHARQDMVMNFPNGEQMSVTLDYVLFGESVHGQLACTDCHSGFEGYPHADNHIQTRKDYSLSYHDLCQRCHPNQFEMVSNSVHGEMFNSGNPDVPSCTDCHKPHEQVRISQMAEDAHSQYAGTVQFCATCHPDDYETYAASIHGEQLLTGNTDMPTCVDCHSVHEIYNPRELKFRKDSIDMCAKCHTDSEVMGKYGLETNVLDTYVVFHDTTVTLLEEYDPDSLTNKPTCYDCHGIHNVGQFDPPALDFNMPGAEQYAPIVAKASPLPVENIGFAGTIVGIILGSIGTLTFTRLMKERKNNHSAEEEEKE